MATDEEVFKYIMKIEGEEEVKQLAAAASLAEQKFEAMYSTFGKGAAQTKAAAAAVVDLNSKLNQAKFSLTGAQQAMTQIGYAADDLQYGFKGIANNIQPILQSIPGLGNYAAALSVVAIAVYQVYEHWDQLKGLMNQGIPQPALTGPELLAAGLKKASDEMEELLKKTRLEWYELDRLNKLRGEVEHLKAEAKAEANVQGAIDNPSEAEKARGAGFQKALDETGGKVAFGDYKATLEGSKDKNGLVYNEAKGRMTSVEDAARDTFDAALKGDKTAREAIKKAVGADSAFGKNIDAFSSEQAEADKKQSAADDADIASEDAARQRKKDRAKERKAKDKEVNEAVEQVQKDLEEQDAKDKHKVLVDTERRGKREVDLTNDYQDELMKDARKRPDQERRKSSVIGAEGLANSIQSSVGGPDKKLDDMIKRQDKQIEYLKAIAENRGGALDPAFQANGVFR